MKYWLGFLPLFLLLACQQEEVSKDVVACVNPFIGTGGHGHTFPGATAPFGMVQLSPDTRLEGWDGCSGYHYSDSVIYGFSHTHLSGTGVSDYGDVLLMPAMGPVQFNNGAEDGAAFGYASPFEKSTEKASAGYYAVHLSEEGIAVELTATPRVGVHRYTLPKGPFHVIIDLEHRDKLTGHALKQSGSAEVSGHRFSHAWATDQRVFFVASFSRDIEKVEFNADTTKAALHFTEGGELVIKVGISPVSSANARENLQAEVDHWDFDRVRTETEQAWREQLQKIEIEGGTNDQRTIFYTALYHTMIAPNLFSDVNGQYRGMDGQVHTADHDVYTVFSLWDTFRALHPLFTIIERERTNDFMKTFLLQYEQGGRLPVWELAGNETDCMIGYHSVPVVVDAYAKGIRDFDTQRMLAAMDDVATMDHFGLASYQKNGAILAGDEAESVSKTLEYAYDDWCIAEFARLLGDSARYETYIQRAQYYKNLFDPETKFFRARMDGGWFKPFDPAEVNFNYTEANAWQYSLFVPQDIAGLIALHGGDSAFIDHLDRLFSSSSETTGREQADITGLIGQYAHGNEPSHHKAYLYNYAGQPWKAQMRVRQIMDDLYQNAPDGLSGNEDCGQMSAWFVLSAMGFYSVTPGIPSYAIGSPLFDKVTIHGENGNDFVIGALNNAPDHVYIQSASLNGSGWFDCDLHHSDIMEGGGIFFEMGPEPNEDWASAKGAQPESEIEGDDIAPVPFFESVGTTFTDSVVVRIGNVDTSAAILYALNGSDAKQYATALAFSEKTVVEAWAELPSGARSQTIRNTWHKIDGNRTIEIEVEYANQYAAGGDNALIDRLRGNSNYRTGRWQGYQDQDFTAVVDLGSVQKVDSVSIGFLQDIKSWIWFPEQVTFSISTDGASYANIGVVANDFPEDQYGGFTKDYSVSVNRSVRFIKVQAVNRGPCPDWHLGAGGKSWLFADEIVVE